MIEFYGFYALNTLFLACGFLYSFKRKRMHSTLWAGLLALHILPVFTLGSLIDKFGISIMLRGQGLMFIGNALMLILLCVLDQVLLPSNTAKLNAIFGQEKQIPVQYFMLMAILAVIALGIRFRSGFDVIYSNWSIDRVSSGYLEALSIYLGFIFMPSTWRAYRSRQYVWLILLGASTAAFFLIAGSRAMLLSVVVAAYSTLLVAAMCFRHKITLLLVLGILGFMLHTGARLTRGMGLGGFVDAVMTGHLITYFVEQESIDLSGGEANIYEWYNYVLKADYQTYPYRAGVTMIRLATIYAPRAIFPYRPIDLTSYLDADILINGALDSYPNVEALKKALEEGAGGSTHPNLWGDAYLNFGAVGFVIYPVVMSLLLIFIEHFLQRLSPLAFLTVVPVVGVGMFDVARGTVVAGFSHIAYTVPLVFVLFIIAGFSLGIVPRIKLKLSNASSPIFG